MGLPTTYQRGGKATASYDWLDLTSGVGYRTYYLCAETKTGGTTTFLTTRTLDANPPIFTSNNGTDTDKDYDIEFNIPAIVNGVALINVTVYAAQGVDNTGQLYLTLNIYHYDGTTETLLGTATTPTRTRTGAGGANYYRECVAIDLGYKKFAVGDILRVTVLHYDNSSGNGSSAYYVDPNSGISVTETDYSRTVGTDFTVDVPFKIDISA